MGIFRTLFGKRPEPVIEPEPEPEPASPAGIVPLGGQFGVMSPTIDTASIEAGDQLHQLALHLAGQYAALDHHAAGVEAVIEIAQKLYGRQVSHQSALQQLQRQRFPIDLMAAGLFQPPAPVQPTAPKERKSGIKSRVGKALRD